MLDELKKWLEEQRDTVAELKANTNDKLARHNWSGYAGAYQAVLDWIADYEADKSDEGDEPPHNLY